MSTKKSVQQISEEIIKNKIFLIRSKKVMLDRDLAQLYGVETKALNQAVKRNIRRFPKDFMFRLSKKEAKTLVTNCDRLAPLKHSTATSSAFTEQGVAMLSSVLNSERAIQVNIMIMRTFTQLRKLMKTHSEIKQKIEEIENKYDYQFKVVFEAIKKIFEPSKKSKPQIGFKQNIKHKGRNTLCSQKHTATE
ncbi:MAG: ORF6N domain-containing protein [Candidatus Zapsychrus exili]|nr:ORF6N domain-containing protein [Candidatus Zapsychrus exili]